MAEEKLKPQKLLDISHDPASGDWMVPRTEFRRGTYNYGAVPKSAAYVNLPYPKKWQPTDEDWQLPENWRTCLL